MYWHVCTPVEMTSSRRGEVDSDKFQQKQHSVVWKHFVRKKTSVCKHCGKTFMCQGGMSNLHSYLKAVHSTFKDSQPE